MVFHAHQNSGLETNRRFLGCKDGLFDESSACRGGGVGGEKKDPPQSLRALSSHHTMASMGRRGGGGLSYRHFLSSSGCEHIMWSSSSFSHTLCRLCVRCIPSCVSVSLPFVAHERTDFHFFGRVQQLPAMLNTRGTRQQYNVMYC